MGIILVGAANEPEVVAEEPGLLMSRAGVVTDEEPGVVAVEPTVANEPGVGAEEPSVLNSRELVQRSRGCFMLFNEPLYIFASAPGGFTEEPGVANKHLNFFFYKYSCTRTQYIHYHPSFIMF